MRHLWFILMSLVLAALGCSDFEDVNAHSDGPDNTGGGIIGTGGSGGVSDGGGGAASTGGGGSTSSDGGAGGKPPFIFSCDDTLATHFTVKLRIDLKPPGHFAADGSVDYPQNSGFVDIPWAPLFVEQDDTVTRTVQDLGVTPSKTVFELNLGMSADTDMSASPIVDEGAWLCSNSQCKCGVLGCFHKKQVDYTFNATGANVIFSLP